MPDLTTEQIEQLKPFAFSLQKPFFALDQKKVTGAYESLVEKMPFWEAMKLAGHFELPVNFENWPVWDRVAWLRDNKMPELWKLIEMLEKD